jgi:mannose-6-phosphate isomerase-like protein (cupin superfamily)
VLLERVAPSLTRHAAGRQRIHAGWPTLRVDKEVGMRRKTLRFGKGFRVAHSAGGVQAAEMVIAPGDAEGGPGNRHRRADQWLFVVSGTGVARVAGERIPLKAGVLLLIRRREEHEIRNTGRTLLRTLNFYRPPAYDAGGEPLAAGRP